VAATLGVAQGGTNIASYTVGDLLYASGATTLSKLVDVATGNVLISGGVGVAPSYGKVALGTHTTGNYVANTNTSILTGLTGGSAGSAGASLTLGFDYSATLAGNPALATGNAVFGTTGLIFEGSTADNFEGLLTLADPTTDNTWTLPNVSGTVITTGNLSNITATGTIASGTWNGAAIGVAYGGTGMDASGVTNGQILIGHDANNNFSLATLTAGNGIVVTNGAGSITLATDILTASDGTSGVTSSFSGLEFQGASNNKLTMLQGCADNQVLAWDETNSLWQCSDKTGGTSNWTDSGSVTYLTGTTDDLAIGGTTSTNSRFYFDVTTGNQIIFEGTGVDDANETTLVITNPTVDRTITIPNETGTVCTTGSICAGYQASITNPVTGTGTNNYNAYWTGTGTIGAEQFVAVSRGGSGAGSFTTNGVLFGNATSAFGVTSAGTSGQILIANVSGIPTFVSMSSDATLSNTGALTISADAVALGTDTTGNYVSSATANGGLTLTGTEGASLGILLPAATDALSATTSSGSGLELLASGLTLLQGCANNDVLAWNETTDAWTCTSVSGTGGVTGTGTNAYVAYWTGTSTIAGEAQLAASRGGTGINTSAATGVPTLSSGTWSVASQLGIALGGTNATTIGSAGSVPYSTGTAYAFSTVGTSGQALISGGAGSPTWFAQLKIKLTI
jgi:hypothetical protein